MTEFQPNFKSLKHFECPEWFRDAKFGIWSHWGPQSVPMFGDWYARNMYIQGTEQYLYHLRHYGHPSKFGYKDICKRWKAEKFDPDALMQLYKKAGARYFVGQASHHDHFFNFPSKLNRFNSVDTGPGKDICGLWKAAAEKEGLPFGLTEHLAGSFVWSSVNKMADTYGPYTGVPYDGNDPEYRDFYLDNYEHVHQKEEEPKRCQYTGNKKFQGYWLKVMKEVIDLYQPDLLYSDGPIPFGWHGDRSAPTDPAFNKGLEAIAYLYNTSIAKYGENRAVYNQKDKRPEIYQVGVLDIEKSQLPEVNPEPWQTDTCIGNWFYDARRQFKTPDHIIEMLIDIVSKNGNMLLNILQRPDGSIDEETQYLLEELATWFSVNGEAIHGTRPWHEFAEGDNRAPALKGFREDRVPWNSSDFRFTCKGNTLYAFMMCPSENRVAVVKSLSDSEKVTDVRLLDGTPCSFNQSFGILTVQLPKELPTKYPDALAIELA